MSENHEAIVVDAKTEEAGAARSRTSALRIRLRGRQPSVVAGAAQSEDPCQEPGRGEPPGRGVRLRGGVPGLDLAAVKQDIAEVLTTSQDWW